MRIALLVVFVIEIKNQIKEKSIKAFSTFSAKKGLIEYNRRGT
jgi:hypothetical protein